MLVVVFLFTCFQLIQGKSLEQQSNENDARPLCPCRLNSNRIHTRVVGGYPAGRNSFPYATELFLDKVDSKGHRLFLPFCGGTLITDRHVLTAAHCFDNKTADEILVDLGVYNLQHTTDENLVPARKLIKHREYVPGSYHTDIGIVKLQKPVRFKKGLLTVPLPNPDLVLKPGTTVVVYGWGKLYYMNGSPDELHAVDLPVMDNMKCKKIFATRIERTMICAGGEEGKDACEGDSGSGLVVQLDNQFVLVGVAAFGHKCALPGIPGVYTRVSSFTDWILEKTKNAGCRPCISNEKRA